VAFTAAVAVRSMVGVGVKVEVGVRVGVSVGVGELVGVRVGVSVGRGVGVSVAVGVGVGCGSKVLQAVLMRRSKTSSSATAGLNNRRNERCGIVIYPSGMEK